MHHAVAAAIFAVVAAWCLVDFTIPEPYSQSVETHLSIERLDWRYFGGRIAVRDKNDRRLLLHLTNEQMTTLLRAGDQGEVLIRGSVYFPRQREHNKGYITWLASQGYEGIVNPYYLDVSEITGASARLRYTLWIRERAQQLDPDVAPLFVSMFTGFREYSPQYHASYAYAGTAHLLAISGLHIGFIFLLAWMVTGLFTRRTGIRLLAGAAAVTLHTAMVGFPIPATRATIFTLIYTAGYFLGRRGDALQTFLLTATLSLLIWPGSIMGASFQFSYLVTGSLILFAGLFSRWQYPWVCYLCFFSSLPVAAWHFGYVNLLGALVNLAAIPVFSAMLYSFFLHLVIPVAGLIEGLHWLMEKVNSIHLVLAVHWSWLGTAGIFILLSIGLWRRLQQYRWAGLLLLPLTLAPFANIEPQAIEFENRHYRLEYSPQEDSVMMKHKQYQPHNEVYAQRLLLQNGISRVQTLVVYNAPERGFRHIHSAKTLVEPFGD